MQAGHASGALVDLHMPQQNRITAGGAVDVLSVLRQRTLAAQDVALANQPCDTSDHERVVARQREAAARVLLSHALAAQQQQQQPPKSMWSAQGALPADPMYADGHLHAPTAAMKDQLAQVLAQARANMQAQGNVGQAVGNQTATLQNLLQQLRARAQGPAQPNASGADVLRSLLQQQQQQQQGAATAHGGLQALLQGPAGPHLTELLQASLQQHQKAASPDHNSRQQQVQDLLAELQRRMGQGGSHPEPHADGQMGKVLELLQHLQRVRQDNSAPQQPQQQQGGLQGAEPGLGRHAEGLLHALRHARPESLGQLNKESLGALFTHMSAGTNSTGARAPAAPEPVALQAPAMEGGARALAGLISHLPPDQASAIMEAIAHRRAAQESAADQGVYQGQRDSGFLDQPNALNNFPPHVREALQHLQQRALAAEHAEAGVAATHGEPARQPDNPAATGVLEGLHRWLHGMQPADRKLSPTSSIHLAFDKRGTAPTVRQPAPYEVHQEPQGTGQGPWKAREAPVVDLQRVTEETQMPYEGPGGNMGQETRADLLTKLRLLAAQAGLQDQQGPSHGPRAVETLAAERPMGSAVVLGNPFALEADRLQACNINADQDQKGALRASQIPGAKKGPCGDSGQHGKDVKDVAPVLLDSLGTDPNAADAIEALLGLQANTGSKPPAQDTGMLLGPKSLPSWPCKRRRSGAVPACNTFLHRSTPLAWQPVEAPAKRLRSDVLETAEVQHTALPVLPGAAQGPFSLLPPLLPNNAGNSPARHGKASPPHKHPAGTGRVRRSADRMIAQQSLLEMGSPTVHLTDVAAAAPKRSSPTQAAAPGSAPRNFRSISMGKSPDGHHDVNLAPGPPNPEQYRMGGPRAWRKAASAAAGNSRSPFPNLKAEPKNEHDVLEGQYASQDRQAAGSILNKRQHDLVVECEVPGAAAVRGKRRCSSSLSPSSDDQARRSSPKQRICYMEAASASAQDTAYPPGYAAGAEARWPGYVQGSAADEARTAAVAALVAQTEVMRDVEYLHAEDKVGMARAKGHVAAVPAELHVGQSAFRGVTARAGTVGGSNGVQGVPLAAQGATVLPTPAHAVEVAD